MERLDEARVIILGDAGAGKTSLARKLQKITNPMPTIEERTVGVDVLSWPLPKDQKGNSMNVHIWDFAGQTVTHAAHRCFMSSRCLYIYVFNGRVERGNDPEYWLEQIKLHGGNSKILFLINEKDGERVLDIPKKSLKEEYPSIIDYYHVNIGDEKNLTALEKFRQTVMDRVRSEPSWNSQNISEDAYRVKAVLNSRFKDGQVDLISRKDFYEIARNQKVPEKDWDSVLDDLRVLGICLWYEDKKMRLDNYVLNPEWITNGIYKIIQWGRIKGKYELSIDDGKEIFVELKDQQRYLGKMEFLFNLMTIYELAYFKKGSSTEIVIPILMPSDKPDNLPTILYSERLAVHVCVDKILPPNIVSRLIVNRHNETTAFEKKLWRKGAVLQYSEGDAIALVREESRSIVIQVRGEKKKQYIASLKETLLKIFEDYKAINPSFEYEIVDPTVLEDLGNRHRFSVDVRKDETPWTMTQEELEWHARRNLMLHYYKRNLTASPQRNLDAYGLPSIIAENVTIIQQPQAPVTVIQNVFNEIQGLTLENFHEILDQLSLFLQTDATANDVLSKKDARTLNETIDEARKQADPQKGWNMLERFIGTSASIANVLLLFFNVLPPGTAAVAGIAAGAVITAGPKLPQGLIDKIKESIAKRIRR